MCGIYGGINISKEAFQIVQNSLTHRGPDDVNSFKHKNIMIGHTRLSIQDIEGGVQPFSIGNYTISFNGEIYNHLEIRKKMLKNINFSTSSDTETLLQLIMNYGFKSLNQIDGMFAACIFDEKKLEITLIRDRAGKKPLYYYVDAEKFIFASELQSFQSIGLGLKINHNNISSFLRTGFFYDENTPWENIYEVKAGHYYKLNCKSLVYKKKKYFDIYDSYKLNKFSVSSKALLDEVDSILTKSIKNRLFSSDLEVGAFLSGGIDSSLIVAIASQFKSKLKTFTVKFDGNFDESSLARLTSEKYSTEHYEIDIKLDLKNDLEKILTAYGEPFIDSSCLPSYYISREAKKYVTVALNGDGADELFGGYRRYLGFNLREKINLNFLKYFKSFLSKPKKKMSFYNYFHRYVNFLGKEGIEYYLSGTTDIFEDVYKIEDTDTIKVLDKVIKECDLKGVDKFLYLDFMILLFSNLLVKMDIASMQHALEVRSPFLSKYFLEFAPKLPESNKISGFKTKLILRELSKKYLPIELINQPKRGFEIPLKKWVYGILDEPIRNALIDNSFASNYVDQKFINTLFSDNLSPKTEKNAKMIWSLYCLEIWYKNLKI